MGEVNYVTQVLTSPDEVNAFEWDALLALQAAPTPFMRHAYLAAMHASGSACPATGWTPHFFVLTHQGALQAACVLYVKTHSYGEYVFDWSWANAYAQHGLEYYPKALIAAPFTPVPGSRLMALDANARRALVNELLLWAKRNHMSSLHLLFGTEQDTETCQRAEMLLRHTVQFHWQNRDSPYENFDTFLSALTQEKRKKIRQERRKVQEAGVTFRHSFGEQIAAEDWDFFYRCYERTYLEHGNAPYLNRDFFRRIAESMPENWVLFTAERNGTPIASSLIAVGAYPISGDGTFTPSHHKVAYGRYWGALERVDCLHFEACFYQPLEWCIRNSYHRFEGGAQGEHKMARALLPVKTTSAHWLAHPSFSDAVARFLEREGTGIEEYMEALEHRSPLRP
ncbi:GNAT family N-acetyltransferase [Rhodoferax aquaticus]|uniref:N-acetyltransferase n=1 Tax=Rhodoferax aquaticus TaxID=2527691 RepID=A0A515EQC1_9BURK|nr:GNAT family N-acetyltransferase [Rhodoferax aquaticus]QDL54857.1 N-acetyltransferase [Rhodoferax aquaticus]